jgi:hypothetical protein
MNNIQSNRDVVMSPSIIDGMKYKSFFGLYGALPIAFTERILYFAKEESVFSFFDEIFAKYITEKEVDYYKIVFNYITLFKRKKIINKNQSIKFCKINNLYNTIGISKLNYFILGAKSPVFINKTKDRNEKIGYIKIH